MLQIPQTLKIHRPQFTTMDFDFCFSKLFPSMHVSLTIFQLVVLALLFALPFLSYLSSLQFRFSSSKTPPGALGFPILGENVAFFKAFYKPLGFYEFLIPRYKMYGNIFKTNVLGLITVFVTGRETGKFIFTNEDTLFNLSPTKSMTDVVGHDNIFQSTGQVHKRLRRTMGEPLSMDTLKRHLNGIEDAALNVLNRWKDRESVRVLDETSDYAFQIISYVLISSRPGSEQDQMKILFNRVSPALVALPFNIPGFAYHKGIKARQKLQRMFDRIIAERRKGTDHKNDFLQSVLDFGTHEGKLSDQELKDNLMAIIFAAYDTSPTALMWATKFIEENHSVENNLLVEHFAIQSKRGPNSYLTWDDVNNMPYTNKFINETLRTANIARLLPRTVLQDTEIGGYLVKKGWRVIIDTQGPHFHAANFVEPHLFNPSRFEESPTLPYTFMPFGGGPRMCIGRNLARIEMAIFIHHLITKYRWKSLSTDSTLEPTLIPKLKNGYLISVDPRG